MIPEGSLSLCILLGLRGSKKRFGDGFGGLKHRQGGASKASIVHEDLAVGVWASKPSGMAPN